MKIEEFTREAIAIIMIVLGVVVLISLLTYTPDDYPDDVQNLKPRLLKTKPA